MIAFIIFVWLEFMLGILASMKLNIPTILFLCIVHGIMIKVSNEKPEWDGIFLFLPAYLFFIGLAGGGMYVFPWSRAWNVVAPFIMR